MSHGDGFGAGCNRFKGSHSDSFNGDSFRRKQIFSSHKQSYEDFGDDSPSFNVEFDNVEMGDYNEEIGLETERRRSEPFAGRKMLPWSARRMNSSQRYYDPPEACFSDRNRGNRGNQWRGRNRPFKRGNSAIRANRGRGSRARGRRPFRGPRGSFSDRRDAPSPSSSSKEQRSGSGIIWYVGPRCSLIEDADSGDYVFMYNSAMQPEGAEIVEKMEVLYGAFYDKKYIKKHDLTTLWEAAWVEAYEDDVESFGNEEKSSEDETESNGAKRRRSRSRSPIDARKLSPLRSPRPAVTSPATNKSPSRKVQ
uniref:Uncharacterized protein n=1 Tax=Plectus sambesii TaxID=2011161 RepID=A0A914WUX5_9BILA